MKETFLKRKENYHVAKIVFRRKTILQEKYSQEVSNIDQKSIEILSKINQHSFKNQYKNNHFP